MERRKQIVMQGQSMLEINIIDSSNHKQLTKSSGTTGAEKIMKMILSPPLKWMNSSREATCPIETEISLWIVI